MICGNSPTYRWVGGQVESGILNLNGPPTHIHSVIHPPIPSVVICGNEKTVQGLIIFLPKVKDVQMRAL